MSEHLGIDQNVWLGPGADPAPECKGIEILKRVPAIDEVPKWQDADADQRLEEAKDVRNEQAIEDLLNWHVNAHTHPEKAQWLRDFVKEGETGIETNTEGPHRIEDLMGHCGIPSTIRLENRDSIPVYLISNMIDLKNMWKTPSPSNNIREIRQEVKRLQEDISETFVPGNDRKLVSTEDLSSILSLKTKWGNLFPYVVTPEVGDFVMVKVDQTDPRYQADEFWIGRVFDHVRPETEIHEARRILLERQRKAADALKLKATILDNQSSEAPLQEGYQPSGDTEYCGVHWLTKLTKSQYGKYRYSFISEEILDIFKRKSPSNRLSMEDIAWSAYIPRYTIIMRVGTDSFGPAQAVEVGTDDTLCKTVKAVYHFLNANAIKRVFEKVLKLKGGEPARERKAREKKSLKQAGESQPAPNHTDVQPMDVCEEGQPSAPSDSSRKPQKRGGTERDEPASGDQSSRPNFTANVSTNPAPKKSKVRKSSTAGTESKQDSEEQRPAKLARTSKRDERTANSPVRRDRSRKNKKNHSSSVEDSKTASKTSETHNMSHAGRPVRVKRPPSRFLKEATSDSDQPGSVRRTRTTGVRKPKQNRPRLTAKKGHKPPSDSSSYHEDSFASSESVADDDQSDA